jgi:hypothetical protein
MKLKTEFYRLHLHFEPTQLRQELSQFSETDWGSYFTAAAGNTSIIMVSVGGIFNHDFAISGQTKPTAFLERCPYFRQVLKALNSPISRCRLTRLTGTSETPAQEDCNYHGFRRIFICVPIVTNSAVKLYCNNRSIQMAAGDAWIFDHTQQHWMVNGADQDCIHLIIETKGSYAFEKMLAQAEQPYGSSDHRPNNVPVQNLPYLPNNDSQIDLEPYCFEVLTSQEISELTTDIFSEAKQAQMLHSEFLALVQTIEIFKNQWEKTFSQFGHHSRGELAYQNIILYFDEQIVPKVKKWLSPNSKGRYAINVISSMLLMSPPAPKRLSRHLLTKKRLKAKPTVHWDVYYQRVDNAEYQAGFQRLQRLPNLLPILESFRLPLTLDEMWHRFCAKLEVTKDELTEAVQKLMALELLTENFQVPKFDRPLFIVSAPRAGSTLLFNTLSHFSELWTIGEESHELIENIEGLHPSTHNFSSNRLTEIDASPHISTTLQKRFAQQLQDRNGVAYLDLPVKQRHNQVRFMEKTPKNALRIPFLKSVFPEALFIYLYREPTENISSMMEGWRSHRFIAYRNLPCWPFKEWSFLLPPGWSSLQNCSIVEIAAYQWKAANSYILDDLQALPKSCWCLVRYSDLIQKPKETISQVSQFAGFQWDQRIEQVVSQSLPISQMTLSTPSPDKWRKNEMEIATVLPDLEPIINILAN